MSEISPQRPELLSGPAPDWYEGLTPADRLIARTSARPRWAIYAVTALVALIGWFWLTFLASGVLQNAPGLNLGPGMQLWLPVLESFKVDGTNSPLLAIIVELCSPQAGSSSLWASIWVGFAMWFTMSIAMMLPSAAPMLRTYGDIADVAVQKDEAVVPLYVLALGYLASWAAFAVIANAVQIALIETGLIVDPVYPVQGVLAGLILLAAGIYQFTPLRNACLEKCRNPFSILFGQWSSRPWDVFRLGMQQGAFCVGCCWALMMVMLVVGTMNLAWMALFTLVTIVEKSGSGKVTSRASGVILLAWGGILLVLAVV